MDRNAPYLPAIALLAALALFLAVHFTVPASHSGPVALSVVQIFMVVLTLVFFIYGAIGTLSVWLEGTELRVRRVPPRPGLGAVVGGLVGAVALVLIAGFFGRLIWTAAPGGRQDTFVQGSLAALIVFIAAGLVLLLRWATVADEVSTEDERTEIPW